MEDIKNNVLQWVKAKISPDFKFRPHQFETICDIIYKCINDETTNYICEAPTGAGKSLINMISAGVLYDYYKFDSYILVSDLFLFSQYEDFIKEHKDMGFGYLKGQTGNYKCGMNGHDIRMAECQMSGLTWQSLINPIEPSHRIPCAKTCKYVKDRRRAMKAGVTVMTYQLFLFMINVVPKLWTDRNGDPCQPFKPRRVMFMDECHNIPSIVQNNASPIVDEKDFSKLVHVYNIYKTHRSALTSDTTASDPLFYDKYTSADVFRQELDRIYSSLLNSKTNEELMAYLEDYHSILGEIHGFAQAIIAEIQAEKKFGTPIPKDKLEDYRSCVFILNAMCIFSDFMSCVYETSIDYLIKEICEDEDSVLANPSLVFHCVKEDYMVYRWILRHTKFRFFTSATVGGHEPFNENNGIKYTDEKTSHFHHVPSTFDFSKSPVYYINKYKMNYKCKDGSIPEITKLINSILSGQHKGERGIIQTGSYEIANKIYNNLTPDNKKRVLLYRGSKEKENMIMMHKISDDTILMGPTVHEGIDLPGEYCRFIIICKMPYPSLGSPYVKAKQELFPTWYNSTTANSIIQGIGRGVRYAEDYCKTYILDGCFTALYRQTQDQFPTELKERILA